MNATQLVEDIPNIRKKLISLFHSNEVCIFGEFLLRCGKRANLFFNSGKLSDGESLDVISDLVVAKLVESGIEFDAFIGLPYKAIPLASAVCMKYFKATGRNIRYGYYRKEKKPYAEDSIFVGHPEVYAEGSRVIILDDILTAGTAIRASFDILADTGVKIVAALVILNRELKFGEFEEFLNGRGVKFIEILRIDEIVDTTNVRVGY
ncbi:orotate phosphoribosyltransferase, putative [Theileria equi strain WA]|uniref:orotate phosphoribosyltransferase n=1 Tax=Theileria equi strain WA TaxID=1537102 RepID=L0B081_THEEQ|nr:orotate phosphoribosyltransferase, putative [Theileria equi strain WA]AFZ80544.1 orotate phosphoribosyltransferase, putative [Theileria equi strain WA]|eukprot:XP_004830210.1 orotate phosphoribosyltransferase, putative [Theileria equi strain WA]